MTRERLTREIFLKRSQACGLYRSMQLKLPILVATLLGGGCIADEADPDLAGDTSTAASAVTSNSLQWFSCAASSYHCSFDLDKRADRFTCFFTGIGGSFKNGTTTSPVGGWLSQFAVNDSLGYHYQWRLDIDRSHLEDAMSIEVSCIPNVGGHQRSYTWNPKTASATPIDTAGFPQRRCFISGVRSKGSAGFSVWNSTAHLFWQGSTLRLGGAMPAGSNDDIQVTCTDVPNLLPSFSFWNGGGESPDQYVMDNPGGIACGLTGIGGTWRDNDSASIDYRGNVSQWWAHVSAGRGGEFSCVQ